jgi:hypothetical protein
LLNTIQVKIRCEVPPLCGGTLEQNRIILKPVYGSYYLKNFILFKKYCIFILVEPISKIVDHAQEQGSGRRKSAAYTIVCEHFEEAGNEAIER